MLLVGYLYGIKSEARLEEEINYNIAYKWFCGLDLTDKAPDATTISQNRRRRFRDNNIAEEIFNEILRQCIAKGLVGGAILYTDSTHIKAKANKHKKKLVEVAVTPKAYLSELDAQVDQEREELGKKPFDRTTTRTRAAGAPRGCRAQRTGERPAEPGWEAERILLQRTPHSGQQAQCDRKCACGSGKHQRRDADARNTRRGGEKTWEAAQVHGTGRGIPQRMDSASAGDEGDTRGNRVPTAHTQRAHYGKYRFRYDPVRDEYICPEKQRLTWKTTTREGVPAILQ